MASDIDVLMREIELYFEFVDIARTVRSADEFASRFLAGDNIDLLVSGPILMLEAVEYIPMPSCDNCGMPTRWPVRFCHFCPPEDIARAREEQ